MILMLQVELPPPSDRKLRYSTSSTISYSDSDWEERATDDELFVV